MFHFLWHRISITLSGRFKGHLVGQVGGVITVTLPSIGQLARGLIDGQQRSRVASTSQIDEWFIFPQGHTQDGFVYKMCRAVSVLDSCKMEHMHICVCEVCLLMEE